MIYPNPVKEKCTMFNVQCTLGHIKVFDMLGNLVLSQQLKANIQKQINIDVSDFVSGIYFLRMSDGKNFFSSRFIKE